MDHLPVPVRPREYREKSADYNDGPAALSRTSTYPPSPRRVSLFSIPRPPSPPDEYPVESSSAPTTTHSSPALSHRSRITIASESDFFYGRIPEVQMFNLFCNEDFPGVANLSLSRGSTPSVNRMHQELSTFTRSLEGLSSKDIKSILVRRQHEYADIDVSDDDVSTALQPGPYFERPNNVEDYVRITQRKVTFKEFPQLTGNYKMPSRSQSLDYIPDLKPTMHLASLLVQTSAYRHLRMDWEVCSEVFSLLRHNKDGSIKYKTAYETLSHMGLHYIRKTSVISRENSGNIIVRDNWRPNSRRSLL
ncbi:hypothetical protein RvY_10189 [Ramazzottius varieornatus]|uniref:Uncharacterized protein n=1 Tax=Ramazzottius varieornatus TaxID=947166 RepID=A0A1D1VKY7_RAMVA|nr:hypothetical protein RvY_10189 [Ramazzottius varieornatus]